MPPETPQPQKEPVGAMIGVIIIFLLMVAGAVYLWQKQQEQRAQQIPYIPSDSSTTTVQ